METEKNEGENTYPTQTIRVNPDTFWIKIIFPNDQAIHMIAAEALKNLLTDAFEESAIDYTLP